jgi:hypothetical protein
MTEQKATDDHIIQHMRFEFSITKATDTHSEYVILIGFPPKQWLRERASLLLCVYCVSFYLRLIWGQCQSYDCRVLSLMK